VFWGHFLKELFGGRSMGTIWAQNEKRRNPFRNFGAVLVSYCEYKQQLKYGAQEKPCQHFQSFESLIIATFQAYKKSKYSKSTP
jgi:hypothetical protein